MLAKERRVNHWLATRSESIMEPILADATPQTGIQGIFWLDS